MTLEIVLVAAGIGFAAGLATMWFIRRNAVPVPPDMLREIDAWYWRKGMSTRHPAIRALCRIGLDEEQAAIRREAWASGESAQAARELADLKRKHADELRDARSLRNADLQEHQQIGRSLALVPLMTEEELDLFWSEKEVFISWTEPMNSMSDHDQREYWKKNLLDSSYQWPVPPKVFAAMRKRMKG